MSNITKNLVPVFPLGFAVPATAGPADEELDKAAIEALWSAYETAVIERDSQGWLALWDADGQEMPPNGPIHDHHLLERDALNLRDSVADTFTVVPTEIVVMGDFAYATGTYSLGLAAAHVKTHHVDGKFMSILRRQDDGAWRIFRGIFNAGAGGD